MIRVLLADDDHLTCAHLSTILGAADDIEVVGQAHDGAEAVESAIRLQPDVILMDMRMPGADGIDATTRITAMGLSCRVVALTSFDDDAVVVGAMRAGASGFLLKSTAPDELAALVRVAAAGHSVLSPPATARLTGRTGDLADPGTRRAIGALTRREREVANLIGAGLSNAQIAARLVLSETTVKGYVSQVLDKLGCANRTQAGLLVQPFLPIGEPTE